MTTERPPVLPTVLTVVGGGFVLAGGLVLGRFGTALATVFGLSRPWYFGGAVLGLLTVVTGVLMGVVPRARRVLGAVALAFAFASIPLAFGGLVLGFGLTAVGGAMSAARPGRKVVVYPATSRSDPSPPGT